MGYRIASQSVSLANAIATAVSTEGGVLTTPPLVLPVDNATVLLFGWVAIVPGTGTTAIIAQIRRGTAVSGPLISSYGAGGNASHTLAAGASGLLLVNGFDNPGAATGVQYFLTVTQTGGTAAGSVNLAALTALIL